MGKNMNKFIEICGELYNVNYIIKISRGEYVSKKYTIEICTPHETYRKYFADEKERDIVFEEIGKQLKM
jgi:hypothetical protein